MMAERWGKSADRVRKIAADIERPLNWDDALRGLPNLNHVNRDLARVRRELEAAVARREEKRAVVEAAVEKKLAPGYRYQGYFTVGAIVCASTYIGEMAEEGTRGVVFEVADDGIQETYGVIFENGLWDWFRPDWVDSMLVTTGLTDEASVGYRFSGEAALQAAFDRNLFTFWPPMPDL